MRIYPLIYILFLVFSIHANSTDRIVVVTEDWPPFNYMDNNGEIKGSSTKTVKAVLNSAKIKYDIQLYPWARSYEIALRRKNTLIYSILRTPDREKLFKWICPISEQVDLILYKLRTRKNLHVDSIEQIKQHITGVTRNDFPHVYLQQLGFEQQHLFLSPDDKSNIKMLLNGRVDYVVESNKTMETILARGNHTMDTVDAIMPLQINKNNTNCMAFNIDTDDKLVQKVQQALKQYLHDRQIQTQTTN